MTQHRVVASSAAKKSLWLRYSGVLAAVLALHLPVHAQDAPPITPTLKQLLSKLPIAGIKDEVQGMVGALKKTSCGGKLTGCYMTQSGPLQLYFFTCGQAQQTLLLVVDKSMPMRRLLGDKAQKVMGETSLSSPIISISTTDYELDNIRMPPPLQRVVRDNYFNVNTLSFSSGVQMAARANLGGPIKLAIESLGVKANQLTMRAAVVVPIPMDLAGGAGTGAAVADALKPAAFIEFQFAPNASVAFGMPRMTLTDATFFLDNSLMFGYKGNAGYKGAETKTVITHFQTPLSPAGGMDLLDFLFRMATPVSFTMEDAAHVMVAMATPDPRLAKYGGGFIRDIEAFKGPLLAMTKPLSVIQLRNPNPPPAYRFGDSSQSFPHDNKHFNFILLGPLADGGPLLNGAGDVTILGQRMGWLAASAGQSGLNGDVGSALSLKLGPLGKVKFSMQATLAINAAKQDVNLLGNFGGQKVSVGLSGSTMKVEVSASCVNAFEIKTQVGIQANTNIADVFEGQGGVNVDPAKIGGCIGKELEAAYNKIAKDFSHLGGYTASAANAELNKIANAAEASYNQAKREPRKAAESSINAASKSFNSGFNSLTNGVSSLTGSQTGTSTFNSKTMHFDSTVFDWDYYYDRYPDLVKNKIDLVKHWDQTGYPQRWRGSLEFDAQFYAKAYPDVAALYGNSNASSMISDWLLNGSSMAPRMAAGAVRILTSGPTWHGTRIRSALWASTATRRRSLTG